MKKLCLVLLLILLAAQQIAACPVCEKRQPKGFASITHGTGPESAFDYFILYGSIVVVLLTLFLFLKYLFRPDKEANHVSKYHIFN